MGVLVSGVILAIILVLWLNISTTTTTSTSTTTVTTICLSGYSRAPSGRCVNLMIDLKNCGSFNYECSSNYTSCSAGVCSTAPAVQLQDGVSIFNNTGIDDQMFSVDLPLNITMYNYSTSSVFVTTNGVSFLIISLLFDLNYLGRMPW